MTDFDTFMKWTMVAWLVMALAFLFILISGFAALTYVQFFSGGFCS